MSSITLYLQGRKVDLFSQEASGFQRTAVLEPILGRLVHDIDGNVVPGLLRAWIANDRGDEWKLFLRPGLKFHNGRDVVAEDLRATFQTILDSPLGSPEKSLLTNLKRLDVVDPLTLSIKLSRADKNFISRLLAMVLSPAPPECFGDAKARGNSAGSGSHLVWKDFPAGAGHYRVVEVKDEGSTIIYEKFDQPSCRYGWLRESASRLEIYTGHYRGADVALGAELNPEPTRLRQVLSTKTQRIQGIYFNYSSPLARKAEFRRAVAAVFDRAAICEKLGMGVETWDTLPSEWRKHTLAKPQIQRDEARAVFASLVGGQKFVIPTGVATIKPLHEMLAEQLNASGMNVEFVAGPYPTAFETTPEVPFFSMGFIPSLSSPLELFEVLRPGGSWAPYADADPEFLALLDELGREENATAKAKLEERLSAAFAEKAYSVPLFELKATYFIDPKTIASVRENEQPLEFYAEKIKVL